MAKLAAFLWTRSPLDVPSDIPEHDFKRRFKAYGVAFISARKHKWKMEKEIDGKTHVYVIPTVSGRFVKEVYQKKARKIFRLTEDDGISDDEFLSK